MNIICSVARSGKRPILFLPKGKIGYGDGLPKGDLPIVANGRALTASIAKIACNVVRDDDGKNVLPEILIGWFGVDAGAPGTPKMPRVLLRTRFGLALAKPRNASTACSATRVSTRKAWSLRRTAAAPSTTPRRPASRWPAKGER